MKSIALLGNPNAGKTTLFNQLTGAEQKVGNWPGVTVACATGHYCIGKQEFSIYDLPGLYSLNLTGGEQGLDERLAIQFLLQQPVDIIINVVDASQLERQLYLSLQLLETGLPVIVVINRIELLLKKNQQLDLKKLQIKLNCPVIAIAENQKDFSELDAAIQQAKKIHFHLNYPQTIEKSIQKIHLTCPSLAGLTWNNAGHLLLEGQQELQAWLRPEEGDRLNTIHEEIQKTNQESADVLMADCRYAFIRQLLTNAMPQTKSSNASTPTSRVDKIFLHRIFGIPCFLLMMYLLFFLVLNIGGAIQTGFNLLGEALFIRLPAYGLAYFHFPPVLSAFLAHGIGTGLNTLLGFVPILAFMFFLLSFLENSGYMARAAFVMDRAMRFLGLPGKSFVPFLIGFGCNVPAVLAARTLENSRDRVLTILMTPFMSCSARLAIYAVFAAAFFRTGGQNMVFALYLFGILMAIFTGLILRKCWLKGEPSPLIMELPAYRLPKIRELFRFTWQHLSGFIRRAAATILIACTIIGGLDALTLSSGSAQFGAAAPSVLAVMAQKVTPLFSPIGIDLDNWPATVALFTGVVAKEVVIATLNTLYDLQSITSPAHLDILTVLIQAGHTMRESFMQCFHQFYQPWLGITPTNADRHLYGAMHQYFTSIAGAFAYLLFILLYYPCISTIAAISRELNTRLAIFATFWSLLLAYGCAVIFYQTATWQAHPLYSMLWISISIVTIAMFILLLRRYGHRLLTIETTPPSFTSPITACATGCAKKCFAYQSACHKVE